MKHKLVHIRSMKIQFLIILDILSNKHESITSIPVNFFSFNPYITLQWRQIKFAID